MFFPNLRKIPALFAEKFKNSSEFSLITGWTLWASITILSYLHYVTNRMADQTDVLAMSFVAVVIALAIGFPGAFANVLWSKVVKTQEPNRQLFLLLLLIVVYYAPVVISGWPKGDGYLSLTDIIYYGIEMFSLVILRIIYSEVVNPLFTRIAAHRSKREVVE